MKLPFISLLLFTAQLVTAQVAVDSVTIYMRELIPNKTVTRSLALDKAAELHVKYLIEHKKVCHLQEDNPSQYSVRNRAELAGDSNGYGGYSEILWAGEPYLSESIKESIYYFQGSPIHWNIMTKSTQVSANVKFGYCRITTADWDACVIIFSSYH